MTQNDQQYFSFYDEIRDCENSIERIKEIQDSLLDNRNKMEPWQLEYFLNRTSRLIRDYNLLQKDITDLKNEEES